MVGVALGDHDRPILEAFRSKHRLTAMRIENHRLSSQQFFESVAGSFGLIGVRLHSAVLASCVGVPPILFAYRSKCQDFMSSMDIEDFALPLWPEVPPDRLRSWFERILAEPQLGVRLYQKALSWKRKQEVYYGKLRSHLRVAQRN